MGFVCVLCSLELLLFPKYITIITFYCDVIKGTNSQLYSSQIANSKRYYWYRMNTMRTYENIYVSSSVFVDEETT